MSFTIKVNNKFRVQNLWLDSQQQRELGEFAVATIQRRIRGGINVNDQPAAPLTENYTRRKLGRGLYGLRDLTFTGAMLNNFGVLEVGSAIRLGFSDPTQALKAGVNESHEKMIGLSRFDQRAVIEKHDELLIRAALSVVELVAA